MAFLNEDEDEEGTTTSKYQQNSTDQVSQILINRMSTANSNQIIIVKMITLHISIWVMQLWANTCQGISKGSGQWAFNLRLEVYFGAI